MGREAEDEDRVDGEGMEGKEIEDGTFSSGSDSDDEGANESAKRTREQLEQEEVEALKNDLGQDLREGKRIRRVNAEAKVDESAEREELSSQSKEVFDSFKKHQQSDENIMADEEKPEEMVLVKRTYRFAGEVVNEEKLLPASHPDAIAYLARKKEASRPASTSTASIRLQPAAGPRKKKSSLAAMSAAATGKPVKINTLEKSKMDWNQFKELNADETERDEMEAQTRGGSSGLGSMKGYMERKSFLDRVQGRVEDQRKG